MLQRFVETLRMLEIQNQGQMINRIEPTSSNFLEVLVPQTLLFTICGYRTSILLPLEGKSEPTINIPEGDSDIFPPL